MALKLLTRNGKSIAIYLTINPSIKCMQLQQQKKLQHSLSSHTM